MARVNALKNSGNAGEISPRLHARTDFAKYRNAIEVGLNVIPLPEGALMRRPGSRFVSELLSSSVRGRLRPFQFSTTQAYMLELANNALRFYRHQARISIPATDAAFANGTFTANITGWDDRSTGGGANAIAHDAANGRLTLSPDGTASDDIAWAEDAIAIGASFRAVEHAVKFQVLGAPGDRIEFQVGSSSTGAQLLSPVICEVGYHVLSFNPGGNATVYPQFRNLGSFRDKDVQIDNVSFVNGVGVNIDTPWPESVLYELTGPQSLDEKYFFHDDYPTYKLQRLGHTSWHLVEVAWQDGPWLDENDTATTLTFSGATGLGITITASAVAGINDGQGFKTTDIGRLVRLTDGTVNWGWAIITAWTSTTVVTGDVRRTVTVTTGETKWRLGAWSGTTGYPSCAGFFEQRLYAANNGSKQETFWASQTADFENHSPDSPNSSGVWNGTVEDDDALDYTLSADDAHAIRWLSPGEDTLVLGTVAGEWVPESQGAVLTPTDITVRQQTSHGSARIDPVRVGSVVLFAQKAKRKIREFGFSFENDGYRGFDMTRLAEHITRGGIVEMAYQQEPDSLVWSVRSDGTLLSMTYRREEDVVGWARHVLGGAFSTGKAIVESVAVIPGADGAGQVQNSEARNEVWIIVKRTINGSTKRYIEVFEENFEGPFKDDYDTLALWRTAMLDAQKDAYFSDSLITYDSVAASTITGLTHLEGQTAKVLSDGAIHDDEVVTSAQITLDADASTVQVGLGYTHRIRTLKFEDGAQAGTAVGRPKKIVSATFVVLDALTMSFGPNRDNLTDLDFREVDDPMDSAPPLFTGEVFKEFDGDEWNTDPRIVIESSDPVPFTLLAIAPQLDVRDLI